MSGNQNRGRGRGRGDGDAGRGRGRGEFGRSGGRGNGPVGSDRGRGSTRGGRGSLPFHSGPPGSGLRRGGPPSVAPGIYLEGTKLSQPTGTLKNLEDARLEITRSRTYDRLPGRKSYGTAGKPVTLRTNYFHLQLAHDVASPAVNKKLYRYEVKFSDADLQRQKKRQAIEQILAWPEFQDVMHASDYAANIVTTQAIDQKILDGKDPFVRLPPKTRTEDQSTTTGEMPKHVKEARARNTVGFKIDGVKSFSVSDLIDYISSTSQEAHYAGYQDLVQVLNIIMCKAPNEAAAVAKLPGNKFYPHQGLLGVGDHPDIDFEELAGGLVALRGYFSSVRCATGRILLNLNVTSGAFYQTVPLLDLFAKFGNPNLKQCENFVRKLKVQYDRHGNNPVKSIKTIYAFGRAPGGKDEEPKYNNAHEAKFEYQVQNGPRLTTHETTVFNYFKGLGINLKRPDFPVLNVGNGKDPIYVPAELCSVLPGQPYRKILSGEQTTQMLRFAARFPNQNAMSIAGDGAKGGTGLKLLQLIGGQRQLTERFGVKVDTSMLTVQGRILNAPLVQYGKKSNAKPFNGSWNCAGQTFVQGGRFISWTSCVLNLPGCPAVPRDDQAGNHSTSLTNLLGEELKTYGIQMGEYKGAKRFTLEALTQQNRGANNAKLDNIFSRIETARIPLVFIILPANDKWLYARIKYYADTRYGIHTVCCQGSKLADTKGQGMYMGNLALKFNLKGGGINHGIANTLINPLDANTMLMGIDVTHPSPGSAQGAPSIATVVASKDRNLSQWPGSLRKQKGKQEMINQKQAALGDCVNPTILESMIIERLECWRNNAINNKQLPKKILVYRDGVSERQYALVLAQELPHFESAFRRLYGPEKNWPRMAIIVVGKRHHTRFYATKEADADYNPQRGKGSLNTKPGTVVDRGITGTTYHEFYLQAHQGLQGTARPAHYVIIKDDIGFDANSLEQITHHLCYLFGRAPKAVSYVPPAYYADILATRGRAYLFNTLQENHGTDSTAGSGSLAYNEWDGKVHPRLKDSMFYI